MTKFRGLGTALITPFTESGALDDIFSRAGHPYLRALLRAVPRFDMRPGERLTPLRDIPPGDAPHLMAQRPP